jgi:hypothetical protein
MASANDNQLSGFALYLLWFLLFVFFSTLIGAVFGFSAELAQGFPLTLLIGRLVVVGGIFAAIIGLLAQKAWGVWLFFACAVVMVPLSVAYSYYHTLQLSPLALTTGWIIRNTVLTTLLIMGVVTLVLYAVRPRRRRSG